MWYKLKRIMMRPNGVEKQVRPSVPSWYTYSYDFTTWSMADFTADWWTVPAQYTIDSTWLRCSDNWKNIEMDNITSLNDALQTATTIEIKLVWSKSVSYCDYFLFMGNGSNDYCTIYWNGHNTSFSAGWTSLYNSNVNHSNTEFTSILSINLSTWACEYSDTVGISWTWTIDNTAISNILTVNKLSLSINSDGKIKSMQIIVA